MQLKWSSELCNTWGCSSGEGDFFFFFEEAQDSCCLEANQRGEESPATTKVTTRTPRCEQGRHKVQKRPTQNGRKKGMVGRGGGPHLLGISHRLRRIANNA